MVSSESGEPARRGPLIFVEDFTDVECTLAVARRRLTGDGSWFAPLASAAAQDGETLQMRIGPSWVGGRLTRDVRVTTGPPRDRVGALVVPLAWEPSKLQALFPVLNGDMELAPIGRGSCRLTLSASYAPPLGELGTHLDHAVLHHVAQSTVRSFLARVAAVLQADAHDPAAPTAPNDRDETPDPVPAV
jgi:hypothetical protein